MIYKAAFLTSLLVAGGAASSVPHIDTEPEVADETAEYYSDITSVKHPAKLLMSEKSHKKWVKFPEQLSAHSTALAAKTRKLRTKEAALNVVSHEDFFKTHAATFGLSSKVEMMIQDITPMARTKTVRQRYEQYYDGVRVLTGDYIVNVGAHDGVLHAHGSTYSDHALKHSAADFKRIKAKKVDTVELHKKVKDALLHERSKKTGASSFAHFEALKDAIGEDFSSQAGKKRPNLSSESKEVSKPKKLAHRDIVLKDISVELVVHPEWLGRGLTDSSLAYFVKGSATVDGAFMSFQVSLDAESFESRLFIDQTNRVLDSTTTVKNADDYSINLYSLSSFYSDPSHVWSNGNPSDPNPPDDTSQLLVDASVQTANLIYSLTGGEFLTWNYTDTPLNIVQFGFDYGNAFFDRQWGIWFGSGLETTDIIGHEWAHGYTQTMNDLIYYEDSGALNEAFSDIIGESVDLLSSETVRRQDVDFDCTTSAGGGDSSERWAVGEDSIYQEFRDMYMPECHGHPSNTRSYYYDLYWCFDYFDGYGVHTNSGVMNKVFSALADDGLQFITQIDYDIPGIRYSKGVGLTKALNLIMAGYADLTWYSVYQDAAAAIDGQCDLLEAAAASATGAEGTWESGTVYRPKINDRIVKVANSFSSSACRRVKKILKRSYMYEDPIEFKDCLKLCDHFPTICGGDDFSSSYSY